MGPRNAILLLLAVLALLVGGTYLLLNLGDGAGGAKLDSGVSAGASPVPAAPGPAADLVTPGAQAVTPAPETARSPVAPAPGPGERVPAPGERVGPRIRGRIVDTMGGGVPGARVVVAGPGFLPLDATLEDPGEPRWTAETDAEGRFALQGPPPGVMRLAVRCAGFAPYTRADLPLPAGEEVELDPIVISLGAILSGRVVDPRGRGVAGASLSRETNSEGLWTFSGLRSQVATTDENGAFVIDQLACGAWKIVVESEEFPDRAFEGLAESPGREYGGLEFRLLPGDRISGRVLALPAEGAEELRVRARRVGEGGMFGFRALEVRFGDVGAGGAFVVRGLRPDEAYELQLQVKRDRSGAWWWGGGGTRSETVRAMAGDRGVELAYRPEAALVFRVLDAETHRPVTDYRVEAGIDWRRPLEGEDGEPLLVHPDGRARYGNLRPTEEDDRVDLEVIATGYERYQRDEIELAPGQELDLGEILLEPVPVLRVTVLDAGTMAPVVGAEVELEKQPEPMANGLRSLSMSFSADGDLGDLQPLNPRIHRAETDEEGVAVLTSLPGETCRLRVTADGFARFEKNDIPLPSDEDAAERALLLAGGGVRVRVVGTGGEALPGIGVSHRSPSDIASGDRFITFGPLGDHVTNTEGEVLFEHLATGEHAFRIEPSQGGLTGFAGGGFLAVQGAAARGEDPGWEHVQVVEGETASVTLVAKPRGALLGRVRESGVPLAGATLRLARKTEDGPGSEISRVFSGLGGGPTARTDGDGLYELDDLEEGFYTLTVEHPTRHMSDEFEVRVREGENRYDLELAVSVVEGRITDRGGEPLVGLRVSAQRPTTSRGSAMKTARMVMVDEGGGGEVVSIGGGDALSEEVLTDEDGRYRLRGVTPDIELQVEARGAHVRTGRSETLRVGPDQVKTGVDFQLDAAGSVRVEVVKSDGSPVRFAPVRATWRGEDAEGVSPVRGFVQNGFAVLEGLRPGPWLVTVSPLGPGDDGESRGEREVEVVAREEASLTLPVD